MGPEISTACRRPLCFLGAAALASSGAGPSVINTSSLIKEVVGAGRLRLRRRRLLGVPAVSISSDIDVLRVERG